MQVKHTSYTNNPAEFGEVLALLSELYGIWKKPLEFTLSRLELWRHHFSETPKQADFYTSNLELWRDSRNKLVGFFISEEGENDIYIAAHPGYPDLSSAIVEWIMHNWAPSKKGDIWTEVYTYNEHLIKALTGMGFSKTDGYGQTPLYDLTTGKYPVSLPEGFTVKTAEEYLDLESRLELIQNAYGNPHFTREVYDSWRSASLYNPAYDFSIISPGGKHAATCMAWIDRPNSAAEIETVGTHSDFRKKGLARSVISACLTKLQTEGIKTAFITSLAENTHRLYSSLDHSDILKHYIYSRKL